MKIFLDTANLDEIRWATTPGLIDGILTSASAIAAEQSGVEFSASLLDICRLVQGPVSVDVAAVDADEMYREGRELARVADNIVIRIPFIEEGIIATHRLAMDGVRVNTTLVYTAAQVAGGKVRRRVREPFREPARRCRLRWSGGNQRHPASLRQHACGV